MKNTQRNEKILKRAAGFLVLSMLLMVVVIPFILNDQSPGASPKNAGIGVSLAILIRMILFLGFLKLIRDNRKNSNNRQAVYIVLGSLVIFFGLIYMDGAFAFLSHDHMLHVSIIMFASIICDFTAGLMTIILFFLKPQKPDKGMSESDVRTEHPR